MVRRTHGSTLLVLVTLVLGAHSSGRSQMHYENSLSFSAGAYAASGFNTNVYYGARYDYFFLGGRYFVEAALGFSSLKSNVLESFSKLKVFESDQLFSYEFVLSYDATPSGYIPFVVFGVAGVNQGGQSNFAGVIGLGKRVPMPGFLGTNQIGIRYDVRDQIFSQKINDSDPFISHNIVFTLGLQLYF